MSFRLATIEDMDKVFEIMHHEVEHGNNVLFVPETEESKKTHVGQCGITLLCEQGQELSGYLIMHIPNDGEDNLARDIGLPVEEYKKVAHMESLLVSPSFRGQGIGKQLMAQGEKILVAQGYIHLMATVHPENMGSLKTMLSLGYEIIMTKEKYGGKTRHIMKKEVSDNCFLNIN